MTAELTIGDLQEIEMILLEASAWGLRVEVEETAKKYIDEGHDKVESYHWAYGDWIK
jgi:hypothetical protein